MILVTGATGTNGSEIVKQLTASGAAVRALVRSKDKAAGLGGPKVTVVEGDLDKPATLGPAVQGAERVLVLSALDPRLPERERNVVAAAKKAGVKHLVKFSAAGADVKSPIIMGRWHGQSEQAVKESGIPWTILRPNAFYQNTLWDAPSIKSQGAFYNPVGDGKISMVDVRDIAAVAVKVLTGDGHAGKTYTLTGPAALSYADVAGLLSEVLNKKVKYVPVAPEDTRKAMLGMAMPEWMVSAMLELFQVFAKGYAAAVSPDVQQVTGKPPISFKRFAQDYAQAFC